MATRTQIYKEVLREYDALRTRKAAELRERREAIYMKFPRLEEIERELSLLGVSTAKLVLMQPESRETALAELKEKQQQRPFFFLFVCVCAIFVVNLHAKMCDIRFN